MSIFITGANGFLGRYVVRALIDQGAEPSSLRCLVRRGSALNGLDELGCEIVRGSVEDTNAMRAALDGVETVVHLAASKSGSPMGMYAETVVSTEKLLEAMKEAGTRRLVFCSSFSVYGGSTLSTGDVFDEECPLEPHPEQRDTYAWVKYYQELWVRQHSADFDLVIIRPGVIYGEDQGLMSPRVGMQLPGLPVFLRIGGDAKVPLVHVESCAALFARATRATNLGNAVFNAVDDDCPTQKHYLDRYQALIAKVSNKLWMPYSLFVAACWFYDGLHRLSKGNFPAIFSPYKARSMYRDFNYSNARAKEELGWEPTVNLEDGLRRSADFIREAEQAAVR